MDFDNTTYGRTDLSACDNSRIQQAGQYDPNTVDQPNPFPPSGGPGGCNTPDGPICPCGGICDASTGDCIQEVWQLEDERCSPIIIAVGNGSNYSLTSPREGVWFDIDGDGNLDRLAWTNAWDEVAFLVLDRNENGRVDDGTELFGNHTILPSGQKASNGFDALAYYDRPENGGNGDGKTDSGDLIWGRLRLWIDWNHNGFSEGEELYSLSDFEIESISLDSRLLNRRDGYGNLFRLKASCRMGNRTRPIYDVFFSARPQRRPN